jgi:gas vesicle protein
MPWRSPSVLAAADWAIGLIGSFGALIATIAGAVAVVLKANTSSYRREAIRAKSEIKDLTNLHEEMRADRDFWKREAESLRTKLGDRDRVIEERDRTIADRDRVINDMLRKTSQLSEDVASLGEAFLMTKGDMKRRKAQP